MMSAVGVSVDAAENAVISEGDQSSSEVQDSEDVGNSSYAGSDVQDAGTVSDPDQGNAGEEDESLIEDSDTIIINSENEDSDTDNQDIEDQDVDNQDIEDQDVDNQDVEDQDVDNQDVEDQNEDNQDVEDQDDEGSEDDENAEEYAEGLIEADANNSYDDALSKGDENGGALIVVDPGVNPYDEDSLVGNLSIIARYTEGENIFYGHSYILFTSYLDNLTLSFKDLYGYYTFDEDYKALTEEDTDALSWRYDFYWLAADLYPDLTLEEYTSLSMDERKKHYPDLYEALEAIAEDQCFILHLGTEQENNRYRVVACEYELNKGDYLTIGNYNMSGSSWQAAIDAIRYSDWAGELIDSLQEAVGDGYSSDEIFSYVTDIYMDYVNGDITQGGLISALSNYVRDIAGESGYEDFLSEYTDYLTGPDFTGLIDGTSTGGIFVNRELNSQKAGWDQSPNMVYSVDITGKQLSDLMAYINSGQNYFNAFIHNCSTVSTEAWNAAVGFVRDENDDNTDEPGELYIDAVDTTYSWISGLMDSPKQVYRTIESWADGTLGGVKAVWEIVHGVAVPEERQADNEDQRADNNTRKAGSFTYTSTDASPQTGDDTHYPELACMMIFSGVGILFMRKLKKVNTDHI